MFKYITAIFGNFVVACNSKPAAVLSKLGFKHSIGVGQKFSTTTTLVCAPIGCNQDRQLNKEQAIEKEFNHISQPNKHLGWDTAPQSSNPTKKPWRGRKHRYIFRTKNVDQFSTYSLKWGLSRGKSALTSNPKLVSVENSYFNGPHPFVRWEGLNEAWEVFWYQNHKLNAKPFPVRLFGLLGSKKKAIEYVENMLKLFGDAAFQRPKRESPDKDVHYDEALQSWGVTLWRDGKLMSRYFSAGIYGYEAARQNAIGMRTRLKEKQKRELEKIYRLFNGRSQPEYVSNK